MAPISRASAAKAKSAAAAVKVPTSAKGKTPVKKVATPKTKSTPKTAKATPKAKATSTPKAKATGETPKKAATPKVKATSTPKAKSTPKKAATPKAKAATPKAKATPKPEALLSSSDAGTVAAHQTRTTRSSKKLLPSVTTAVSDGPSSSPKKDAAGQDGQGGGGRRSLFFLQLVPVLLVLLEYMCRTYLDLPLVNLCRNMLLPPTPAPVAGKYECSPDALTKDVTVVVTVKDACSPAPQFIKALHDIVPSSVHLIYTYPNFTSCASVPGMDDALAKWDKVTKLPLGLRVSPMHGWVASVAYITTPYALLLHNDGYALDHFMACELVGALKKRREKSAGMSPPSPFSSSSSSASEEGSADWPYIASAPMLYESKADGSLAAHATQSNLRLVSESKGKEPGSQTGRLTVRHDHSAARALNRGFDVGEGPQSEFLEDHGFMIETDKIATVVDPHASYTLEYIDMILTIRANKWQVLFVPTARLEFRVTEFAWRDIPYFMYKRSERTCHGTRDYLTKKWGADFPNTGFWTYIKYTIVEQHLYGPEELAALEWKDSAAIAFGFFEMIGFNRYHLGAPSPKTAPAEVASPAAPEKTVESEERGVEEEPSIDDEEPSIEEEEEPAIDDEEPSIEEEEEAPVSVSGDQAGSVPGGVVDYISVLEMLDAGLFPLASRTHSASRDVSKKAWLDSDVRQTAAPIERILDTVPRSRVSIEADMPLEYLPFAALELRYPILEKEANEGDTGNAAGGLNVVPLALQPLCGLVLEHPGGDPGGDPGDGVSQGGRFVSCWINLPTFKSNSFLMRFLDRFAALIKLPSRVTTYVEMALGSTNPPEAHVAGIKRALLKAAAAATPGGTPGATPEAVAGVLTVAAAGLSGRPTATLLTCQGSQGASAAEAAAVGGPCGVTFELSAASKVLQFTGKPPSSWEVLAALK